MGKEGLGEIFEGPVRLIMGSLREPLPDFFRRPNNTRDKAPSRQFAFLYQFRVLKKWRERLCLGPGARPERAGSIGWVAPYPRGSKLVSSGGGGGVFSPPHPRRNQRLMIPIPPLAGPRALESLGSRDTPFFRELKCYVFFTLQLAIINPIYRFFKTLD